jgi:myo-inositol-1(or 4)-monophosphatase
VSDSLFAVLRECAHEIGEVVKSQRGRGLSGERESQYFLDVAADEVALRVLGAAGLQVVSEESGITGTGEYTVVVDPIDGSTNCDRGIPFYATSLAVMHGPELVMGLVKDHSTGDMFEAQKGAGATCNDLEIRASSQTDLSKAIAAFSGLPSRHLGWAQCRALGAASLEICLVANGALDIYAVAQQSTLNPWDYLAGMLIALEAGAVVRDYHNEKLETSAAVVRRPVFAGTKELLSTMLHEGTL